MAIRLRRPRYAEIVATLALFAAMGGTAYAATALPKNSVGTAQIKKHAVTGSKIDAGVVSEAKLADGSVTNVKLATGSVDGSKVVDNSLSGLQIADGSIDSGEIVDGSIFSTDLGNSSVTLPKLAGNSVDGSKVTNESLTLSDLAGANVNGAISFSLAAGTCATLNMSVGGAQVGQAAFLSWAGNVTPAKIVTGPMRVSSAGHVEGVFCNEGSTAGSFSNQPVHIVTFG